MIINYSHECVGLQSSEHNLIYFPILKNAHTWAEKFVSANFNMNIEVHKNTENYETVLKDKVVLVILRDPLLRWLSAVTQYFIESDTVQLLDNTVYQQSIKDIICFDDHSNIQVLNLLGINTDNCVFFRCDDQLEENMNLFSKFWFNKETVSVGKHQVMIDNPDKVVIFNKLKNIARNDVELLKRIREFYAMDYKLISSFGDRFIDKKVPVYYNMLKEKYD